MSSVSVKPRKLNVGEECIVTIGKKKVEHKATVVARGKQNCIMYINAKNIFRHKS